MTALAAVPTRPQLFNEAGVDPERWAKAQEGLNLFFRRYGEDISRNFAARYSFHLVAFEGGRGWGEDIYTWHYRLLEAEPLYGPPKYRGIERQRGVFKIPRERVVDEIPANPDWVYRGMSWEEWQNIRRTKKIRSRGGYNIGEGQKNLTLFGERPDTGVFYATGFAPPGFKPGKRRPGVIIAVPFDMTIGPKETGYAISEGERALVGETPMAGGRDGVVVELVPEEVVNRVCIAR
jgi:hypothetical protein